jgi:hypothetical protein
MVLPVAIAAVGVQAIFGGHSGANFFVVSLLLTTVAIYVFALWSASHE